MGLIEYPEQITYEGKSYSLGGGQYPLEPLFPSESEMFAPLERLANAKIPTLDGQFIRPLRHFDHPGFSSISSALHRGYLGQWEISNGFLKLADLESVDHEFSLFSWMFPEAEPPIVATWFTGQLVLEPNDSEHSKAVSVNIENGKVSVLP